MSENLMKTHMDTGEHAQKLTEHVRKCTESTQNLGFESVWSATLASSVALNHGICL